MPNNEFPLTLFPNFLTCTLYAEIKGITCITPHHDFDAFYMISLYDLMTPKGSNDFPGGSMVKNLPATQKWQVRSLSWEDLLEEGMATHSNILAWRIPWTEEPGGLQSMGLQRAGGD